MRLHDTAYRLAELERKMSRLIRFGTITEADYPAARVRVRIGDLITAPLMWLTGRAGNDSTWWAPDVGEQVLVFAPDGVLAQAVVLPAIFQNTHPAPEAIPDVTALHFSDSAVIRYDRAAHHLDVTLPDGASIAVKSTGGIAIEGDVTVTGSVTASGDVSDGTRSMAADRDLYNQHKHGSSPTPSPEQ